MPSYRLQCRVFAAISAKVVIDCTLLKLVPQNFSTPLLAVLPVSAKSRRKVVIAACRSRGDKHRIRCFDFAVDRAPCTVNYPIPESFCSRSRRFAIVNFHHFPSLSVSSTRASHILHNATPTSLTWFQTPSRRNISLRSAIHDPRRHGVQSLRRSVSFCPAPSRQPPRC